MLIYSVAVEFTTLGLETWPSAAQTGAPAKSDLYWHQDMSIYNFCATAGHGHLGSLATPHATKSLEDIRYPGREYAVYVSESPDYDDL